MYNPNKGNPNIRQDVITQCWQYLHENFHKFSEANKIKIALAIGTKNIPTQIEGNITFTEMPNIAIGNRVQEFLVGDNRT